VSSTLEAREATRKSRLERVSGQLFGSEWRPGPVVVVAVALASLIGVGLRFWTPSALWLDEALSVNIARLPLLQIPHALSHDGAPPLYYVMLHFWMRVFGQGDFAVRAMSGLTSVATLPLFWLAGRRLGGHRVAWITYLLALACPFAINYATATRMYSLMILVSLLGYLALARALERPTRGRLVALGAISAVILYTHYWGLYLVASAAGWLVWRIWRRGEGLRQLRAIIFGSLAWLPWFPVFVFQALHTGTPWTSAASPGDLLGVFRDFSGPGPWGTLLMFGYFALFVLGVFGAPAAAGTRVVVREPGGIERVVPSEPGVVLGLKARPGMAPLAAITTATLIVAVVGGILANAAFVARYTAVALPLFLLVAARGMSVLPGRRFGAAALGVAVVAGLVTGQSENAQQRTQAVQVAAVLNSQAQPGDLVVYCPDQLGPAVSRLIRVPGLTQITFPRAALPQRVDWVNYKQTIADTDVSLFAEHALARLPADRTLWLVWRDGYPGFGGDCGYLDSWLGLLKDPGVTLIHANGARFYEFENLTRFSP